jgi:molecular chaperone DnaK
LRNAVKEENVEEMKVGIEKLTNSSHKLAEEIYKQSSTQQEQQSYADASSSQEKEDVQGDAKEGEQVFDAEYKEEDGDNSK